MGCPGVAEGKDLCAPIGARGFKLDKKRHRTGRWAGLAPSPRGGGEGVKCGAGTHNPDITAPQRTVQAKPDRSLTGPHAPACADGGPRTPRWLETCEARAMIARSRGPTKGRESVASSSFPVLI